MWSYSTLLISWFINFNISKPTQFNKSICTSKNVDVFTQGESPFKTFAKFSEKLTFSPPDTNTYVCVSGGKKCWFFGKVLICTKWIISEVICNASCSTGQSPVFPSYRNVLIDLYCKTIDCVLYHRRIGLEWFKFHFSYHYSMLFLNCSFFLSWHDRIYSADEIRSKTYLYVAKNTATYEYLQYNLV